MTAIKDLEPVPVCASCGHEHSAAWTRQRLTATGPCFCGCRIETRATLNDGDHDRVWIGHRGGVWEYSDINGWVVDGMCTMGGFDPEGHGPFTEVKA